MMFLEFERCNTVDGRNQPLGREFRCRVRGSDF